MENNYLILLYYCYSPIEDTASFRNEHHQLCLELDLRGRIIIAPEGLNGTVSGLKANCEKYMEAIQRDERFKSTEFKVEPYHQHAFQKLHVREKSEIVNLGAPEIDPNQQTGKHLEPEEFLAMKDEHDVVILDVRSNYEHKLGKFKDAKTLDIDNFRDFPDKIQELEELKSKKVITYCTGGIKCEKASAMLLKSGFKDVYQLKGGIIKYGLEAGGEDFEGKCYVFDNRIAVVVNAVNPSVVATCYICNEPNDRMVNCANPTCNIHVPICEACGVKYEGACSSTCQSHPDKRAYDGTGYYATQMNGYNPYRCSVRKE